jgi:hypothetical protein
MKKLYPTDSAIETKIPLQLALSTTNIYVKKHQLEAILKLKESFVLTTCVICAEKNQSQYSILKHNQVKKYFESIN